jgi:hypothetical protein
MRNRNSKVHSARPSPSAKFNPDSNGSQDRDAEGRAVTKL